MTGNYFPDLPPLGRLRVDDPLWIYEIPSGMNGGRGVTHLRIWEGLTPDHPWLAVVTELGVGASVTNTITDIRRALVTTYPGRDLVLLEHWPDGEGIPTEEHLQQASTHHASRWRAVWPTAPDHPDHHRFDTWMRDHGYRIIAGTAEELT